jgi:hypothetical protein
MLGGIVIILVALDVIVVFAIEGTPMHKLMTIFVIDAVVLVILSLAAIAHVLAETWISNFFKRIPGL